MTQQRNDFQKIIDLILPLSKSNTLDESDIFLLGYSLGKYNYDINSVHINRYTSNIELNP